MDFLLKDRGERSDTQTVLDMISMQDRDDDFYNQNPYIEATMADTAKLVQGMQERNFGWLGEIIEPYIDNIIYGNSIDDAILNNIIDRTNLIPVMIELFNDLVNSDLDFLNLVSLMIKLFNKLLGKYPIGEDIEMFNNLLGIICSSIEKLNSKDQKILLLVLQKMLSSMNQETAEMTFENKFQNVILDLFDKTSDNDLLAYIITCLYTYVTKMHIQNEEDNDFIMDFAELQMFILRVFDIHSEDRSLIQRKIEIISLLLGKYEHPTYHLLINHDFFNDLFHNNCKYLEQGRNSQNYFVFLIMAKIMKNTPIIKPFDVDDDLNWELMQHIVTTHHDLREMNALMKFLIFYSRFGSVQISFIEKLFNPLISQFSDFPHQTQSLIIELFANILNRGTNDQIKAVFESKIFPQLVLFLSTEDNDFQEILLLGLTNLYHCLERYNMTEEFHKVFSDADGYAVLDDLDNELAQILNELIDDTNFNSRIPSDPLFEQ